MRGVGSVARNGAGMDARFLYGPRPVSLSITRNTSAARSTIALTPEPEQ